jgi:hypothetical protein
MTTEADQSALILSQGLYPMYEDVCLYGFLTASGHDTSALIITLTMIGKFAMTAAFGTVILYAPEIYPTNLRSVSAAVYSNVKCLFLAPGYGYFFVTAKITQIDARVEHTHVS